MKKQTLIWNDSQFRHLKGIPDLPLRTRHLVLTDWTIEIDRLENFFASIVLPIGALKLNNWTTVTDLAGCIDRGLQYSKANNGNRIFYPYLKDLQEIEKFLSPKTKNETQRANLIPSKYLQMKNKIKINRMNPIPITTFVL